MVVDPTQGLALEITGAPLGGEAVDTRHLLHRVSATIDETVVTGRLLGQPCSVHGDQAAVLAHLLDHLSDL